LLIIVGVRVYYRTVGHGLFHCGRCGGDRRYRRRAGQRWFTCLMPVVPLARTGEHVQCLTCRARYVTEVLSQPTTAQMQAALAEGTRAGVVAMLRAGDSGSPASRQRAITLIGTKGARGYDDQALDQDLELTSRDIRAALNGVGAQLTPQAREWYLADVIRVGIADGSLSDTERAAAQAIGLDLGLTQAQIIGVVTMTDQSAGRDLPCPKRS
jgi:hypothetical protein